MAGEEWARRILEKDLKRNVALNDDGTASGMYDLRIGSADAPEMAVECVGPVDPKPTETWNLGPAEGPLMLALKGDWLITLTPSIWIKPSSSVLSRCFGSWRVEGSVRCV